MIGPSASAINSRSRAPRTQLRRRVRSSSSRLTEHCGRRDAGTLGDDASFIALRLGDGWLAKGSAALLNVPSAIVPETFNVLLNPAHQDAKRIAIVQAGKHAIDPRLLK